MNPVTLAQQAREHIQSECLRCMKEVKERHIDCSFLSGPNMGIPVPARFGKREDLSVYKSFFDNIAQALEWYAQAIELRYAVAKEDKRILLILEIIFDDKRCILGELTRKFIQWAKNCGLSFPGLHIQLSAEETKEKSEEEINEIIQRKALEFSKNQESLLQTDETYSPRIKNAKRKVYEMREVINRLFTTSEFIPLQQYPYPRFTSDHIREMKNYAENFFVRCQTIVQALKKNGVDLENVEFE